MFQSLGESDLEVMAGVARQITAERGELIVSQGSDGESLYIVVDGQIRVYVSDEAGKEMILAPEGHGSDGALDGVVIELDAAVIKEPAQRRPAGEHVADGVSQPAARRNPAQLVFQPRLHDLDKRP